MLNSNRTVRGVAILTGGVIAASAVFHPAPAQAADSKNEKLYKGGAVALGVLGAYFILKGKTIPGAVAGAGAYYAYKKGKDANNDRSARDIYPDNRYSSNTSGSSSNNTSSSDTYPDGRWSTPSYNSSGITSSKSDNGSALVLK